MEQITVWFTTFVSLLPTLAIIGGAAFALLILFKLSLQLLDIRRKLHQETVHLELTPPANAEKSPHATQQLFSVLHGLEATRSWKDKLLRRNIVLTLEIVSSRAQGIRYIIRVSTDDISVLKHTIASYLPDVRFCEVEDELVTADRQKVSLVEFKQTGHFAYPLRIEEDTLMQHDPVAYLTGVMTQLEQDESIVIQMVATPVRVPEAASISRKILVNEDLAQQLGRGIPFIGKALHVINTVLFEIIEIIPDIFSSSHQSSSSSRQQKIYHQQQVATRQKPARTLSTFEQQLVESIHQKVSQPLFKVSIRVMVQMNNKHRTTERVKGVRSSLATFSVPKYQALKSRSTFVQGKYSFAAFKHRLPSLFMSNSCILSAAELSDLYHFPFAGTTKTENIVKSLSKTLPAPVSFKGSADFDLILGQNQHHGQTTNIGLTGAERERHVFIIGGTGNGKTTMLQYAIIQDLQSGKGVAVIDPHGDMAETILRHVPPDRINDVVYFNPDDLDYPIGLNLLELSPNLEGNELLREKDLVTEAVISVFRKIFSDDDEGGHRIEYVLRNAIQTALTIEGATLFTIYDLLNNPTYRNRIIKTLKNKDLVNFWENEMGKAGNMQRVKMVAGITAKIGRFLFSASAKRILEQPKSTIDFDDILSSGKILICNFSKGLLGEDTSELFGITVLAKLQMAALRRARTKQADRRPFYLYVDEFQNFATTSFVQMLSEARKYKLFLLMAEQSTSQQEEHRMVNIILANVGTVVCFRSGNPADEQLVLPLFSPYVDKGEIANLSAFNFYIRVSAVKAQEPLSGETIVLEGDGSEDIAQQVVESSRANYASKHEDVSDQPIIDDEEPDEEVVIPGAS